MDAFTLKEWNKGIYTVKLKTDYTFEIIDNFHFEVFGVILSDYHHELIADLDNGESVLGWEDGTGNTITMPFLFIHNDTQTTFYPDEMEKLINEHAKESEFSVIERTEILMKYFTVQSTLEIAS